MKREPIACMLECVRRSPIAQQNRVKPRPIPPKRPQPLNIYHHNANAAAAPAPKHLTPRSEQYHLGRARRATSYLADLSLPRRRPNSSTPVQRDALRSEPTQTYITKTLLHALSVQPQTFQATVVAFPNRNESETTTPTSTTPDDRKVNQFEEPI